MRFSSLNLDQFPLPSIKVVADKIIAKHQKRRLRKNINREAVRDVVTINYVYNRETLAQNEKIYDSGKGMILIIRMRLEMLARLVWDTAPINLAHSS